MSISINIPDELYQQALMIAETHHVPIDEVFASAFADQLAVWQRLQQRVVRGNKDKFFAVLDKVPDVEPDELDRI
ncbi:MAG: hypothetical protein WBW33_33025 [Bryobacteraceae bacterium]